MNQSKASRTIKNYWKILKESSSHFIRNNPMQLAGNTSFLAIFSIAPILIIIISVFGFIVGDETIKYKLFNELDKLIGPDSSQTLEQAIENYKITQESTVGTIIGIVFFLVSATTLFSALQDSINFIWRVRVKSNLKMGVLKVLKDRVFSFGIILSMGFILLISLIFDVLITTLREIIASYFSPDFVILAKSTNMVIAIVITAGVFLLIYRFLPDVHVKWSASIYGALLTSIFITGGKFLIGLILSNSKLGTVYGSASSFIGILIWIYYTSLIFYFGVELSRQYSIFYKHNNKPLDFAIPFEITKVSENT